MDIKVRETKNKGKGIFATSLIKRGEGIFDWEEEGIFYNVEKASDLPGNIKDYAIQYDVNKWVDTKGLGRILNHSCEPNAGIKGLYKLIAVRDISPNEEIVWDYDTTENSDWVMKGECQCGAARCRKIIQGYRFLPQELKKEYMEITSEWLKKL